MKLTRLGGNAKRVISGSVMATLNWNKPSINCLWKWMEWFVFIINPLKS